MATAIMDRATHVLASLYTFSDAAKNELIDSFQSSKVGLSAEAEHTQDNQFIIRCAKDDPSPALAFVELMKNFIQTEMEKELDVFEDVRIARMGDTLTDANIDEEDLAPVEEDEVEEEEEDVPSIEVVENALILHENYSQSWHAPKDAETTDNAPQFSEYVLKMIGDLTNCRVEYEPDGKSVAVRGDDLYHIDQAMSKLYVMHDWASQQSSLPLTYNFHYAEGILDIMLQMVALKELDDRRLNTTLVSPQSPLAKNLGSFLTVVMTRQNTVLLSNPNGRQSKLAEESILWKGICFKPFRSEINPTEIERIATPPIDLKASSSSTHPHLRTVDQWVKQSASEALSDPFSPRIVTKELPTPRPQEFIRPADQPTPVRKRHIKSRKPLGQDVPQTKSLVPNAILIDPIDCSAEFTATASLEAKHPVMINSDIGSYDKSSSGISEGSHSGHESLELKESARKEFSAAAIRPPAPNEPYPPPIKAPYMPLEPRTSSQIDDLDLDPVWQRNTVTTRKGGRLIDIPVMKFSVSEKVQSQRETDTRVVKRTMDQRKPAGFAKSSNSFVILLDSFEKATRRILEVARKSQGMPVDMQVQIGRILISPQSAIPEYKKRPFAVTEWPLAFPAANRVKKLETFFANMLTSISIDMDFVLGLNLPNGRKMFTEGPSERKVTFNFDCRTKAGDQVVIKVDEDGEFEVRSDDNPIGILNWHFPKRCWDARLTVHTSDYVNNDVQEAAQEIVDNLRICLTPDRKSFDLGTNTNSGYLQINSINLHRETSHLSTEHPDILLHLSEVSDLNVWQPSGPKGPYEASLNLQQNMIGNAPKTWCQVSLSSIAATNIFKENSKLELGYIASWTAEDIIATQAVKELCYVARDVVTRIDSVGYLNRGAKGGSGTRASENVKKADNFFW